MWKQTSRLRSCTLCVQGTSSVVAKSLVRPLIPMLHPMLPHSALWTPKIFALYRRCLMHCLRGSFCKRSNYPVWKPTNLGPTKKQSQCDKPNYKAWGNFLQPLERGESNLGRRSSFIERNKRTACTAHCTARAPRTLGRFSGWQGRHGLRGQHATTEASTLPSHQCHGG